MLAKSMQKHAGRAKEKILQNLGKVDRTADDIFDEHLNNFNRQQANANRLQKEFNNYIRCIRAVQGASKSLMDAICEVYEPQWVGYDALQAQSAASEALWLDFAHKLADQVLIPLNTYTGQFPEMKKKIEKRNRKLIDYDGQRHSFQNLQANANKRKDDAKLTKGREQLEEARRTYEILNTELHDELPALYDSRILFLVTNLQTIFGTEQVFHSETAKSMDLTARKLNCLLIQANNPEELKSIVTNGTLNRRTMGPDAKTIYSELEGIVDKLATDSQRGSNTLRKQVNKFMGTNATNTSPVPSPVKQMNNSTLNSSNYQNQITTNGASNANSPTSTTSSQQLQQEQVLQESRPDSLSSVSSTPESTPDNQKAINSVNTTSVPTTPSSPDGTTSSAPKRPSYQDLSAVVKEEIEAVTSLKDSPLGSPNANSEKSIAQAQTTIATATATATITPTEAASIPTSGDVAMNNVAKVENTTTTKTTTTSTTTTQQSSKTTSPLPPTEQLNGNENENNINVDAKQEKGTIQKTEESTTTKEVNNGNIEDNKNASGGKIAKQRNSKLKHNIPYEKKIYNKSSQLVVVGKNPFEEDDDYERIYEVPNDATTTDLPPGVLYRVKATYGYVKEDVDELSFEIGDIIRVIEYDDPEDQEEGWLMGQKEGTNEKGLFPANFTRPI